MDSTGRKLIEVALILIFTQVAAYLFGEGRAASNKRFRVVWLACLAAMCTSGIVLLFVTWFLYYR